MKRGLLNLILALVSLPALAQEVERTYYRSGDCICKPFREQTSWYSYHWDGNMWDYAGGPYSSPDECETNLKKDRDLKEVCRHS